MNDTSDGTPGHAPPRGADAAPARSEPAVPKRRALLVLAGAVSLISVLQWWRTRADQRGAISLTWHADPRPLPALRFAGADGMPVNLADFRGKVVLLNVWATWCAPCIREMPALDRLQAALGGAQFEVVALSIDEGGIAAVQPFFVRTGIRHLRQYVDAFHEASMSLVGAGVPLTLLIDAQGRELARKLGPAEWDRPEMIELIRGRLRLSVAAMATRSMCKDPQGRRTPSNHYPGINMPHAFQPLRRAALTLLLAASTPAAVHAESPVSLMHVHGLSYSADGKQLLIPSHHGLAVFANGRWSKAAGPAHDYMGFSATRDALYSSGHPAPDSGLPNPFGLIKSRDGGRTWQKLGLEGESDFHTLATSYGTNAVYVVNTHPNSRMSHAGIYYTLADGMKWQRADARGLRAKLNGLAVHPLDARLVAAGTDHGLYLSRDSATSFEPLVSGRRVLAQHFDLDGQHLWFSGHAGKATLARVALQAGARPDELPLPDMPEDAVAYIAQNPARRDEMAIATFRRSVFLSPDRGRSWKQIAKDGTGVE